MVSPVEQSESNLGPVTIFRLPPAGVALLARPPFWTKSRYELEEAQRAVNAKGAGGVGAAPPISKFLAGHLTLIQCGGAEYAHHVTILPPPPGF
jgi:hypothetical protein